MTADTPTLDPQLLDILACPQDKGPLEYLSEEQLLVNRRLGVAYRIDDGIPVLLTDEAQPYPAA
ncbi:Trm112 family protein [Corynebacterium sp. Marseille-P3884]|uniref:Trm112 family protein n=1 Tax=Corynebacterium sp. Marseille-P3884 TaxID=2495409 RepID=UPI001B3241D7|nr:Trm112 family protein [Corynebacterium sp. Marseille-P3884]MBP3947564.1 Trm112 family protein [Corynebacterium sp. Marseille-P3884]